MVVKVFWVFLVFKRIKVVWTVSAQDHFDRFTIFFSKLKLSRSLEDFDKTNLLRRGYSIVTVRACVRMCVCVHCMCTPFQFSSKLKEKKLPIEFPQPLHKYASL